MQFNEGKVATYLRREYIAWLKIFRMRADSDQMQIADQAMIALDDIYWELPIRCEEPLIALRSANLKDLTEDDIVIKSNKMVSKKAFGQAVRRVYLRALKAKRAFYFEVLHSNSGMVMNKNYDRRLDEIRKVAHRYQIKLSDLTNFINHVYIKLELDEDWSNKYVYCDFAGNPIGVHDPIV